MGRRERSLRGLQARQKGPGYVFVRLSRLRMLEQNEDLAYLNLQWSEAIEARNDRIHRELRAKLESLQSAYENARDGFRSCYQRVELLEELLERHRIPVPEEDEE